MYIFSSEKILTTKYSREPLAQPSHNGSVNYTIWCQKLAPLQMFNVRLLALYKNIGTAKAFMPKLYRVDTL